MTRRSPQPQAPFAVIICLAKAIRSGPTVCMAKPRAKTALRIRLVEFFGQCVCRRPLIHPNELFEPAKNHVACLRHKIAAHTVTRVSTALFQTPDKRSLRAAGGFQSNSRPR